jgi:hypothetical protein
MGTRRLSSLGSNAETHPSKVDEQRRLEAVLHNVQPSFMMKGPAGVVLSTRRQGWIKPIPLPVLD